MNSNISPTPPSAAQLFGSNYNPDYLQYLPEVVQFEKPIPLVPDFTRTKQLIKEFVQRYDLQLMQKYPAEIGRNGKLKPSRSYTLRRLNSGTMATLDALLEMYGAWCIAVAAGNNYRTTFNIRPSAIKSRRYGAVKQNNTINDHLERLEESGLIKMSSLQFDQSYQIEFNREVLSARQDKNFTKAIVDNILRQCPELARSEDFQQWQKRLKPSFFAVEGLGGTQFLRAYMIVKMLNSNNQKAESVDMGETAFPTIPPSSTAMARSKGAPENQGLLQPQEASLGAENGKDEQKVHEEVITFTVERCWDIARSFPFWNKKKFTHAQEQNTKRFLRMLVLDHIRNHGRKSIFEEDVFLPVLRNQDRSLRSGKYFWRPPSPDIYFAPDFLTDDGRPAGWQAAFMLWQKMLSKKVHRKGTKKKIKREREKEHQFMRWFSFFARIPTVKNMRKSETEILAMQDDEFTKLFYDSVINSNLLPTKKLIEETEDKIKAITHKRMSGYVS